MNRMANNLRSWWKENPPGIGTLYAHDIVQELILTHDVLDKDSLYSDSRNYKSFVKWNNQNLERHSVVIVKCSLWLIVMRSVRNIVLKCFIDN